MDTARSITIEVYGEPAPGGSKRACPHSKTGRMVYLDMGGDLVKAWRRDVVKAAVRAIGGAVTGWQEGTISKPLIVLPGHPDFPMFQKGVAVECEIIFWMPRPKYHFAKDGSIKQKYRFAYHVKTPDVDKLVRSTKDALSDSGIWWDDCQDIGGLKVKYFHPTDRAPGATIRIMEVLPR